MQFSIAPSEEYMGEIAEYLSSPSCPRALPVEYYQVNWRSFADVSVTRTPRGLGHVLIDSRTIRSQRGVDYHTKELLHDFLEPAERAAISVAQRRARHEVAAQFLAPANERIAAREKLVEGREILLDFDHDANSAWYSTVMPRIDDIPFAHGGQGLQAATKIALAMSRNPTSTSFVLVEEPENHLSHTRLMRVVRCISDLAGERQCFITTHSSFVLNRLGLDRLHLLGRTSAGFADLPDDTVRYFKRLSGFDTLRLALADKLVLVEGPSGEMVFERFYFDRYNKRPSENGIDIVSLQGVALRRSLELCHALDRQVIALRDNDGQDAEHWRDPLSALLLDGRRELFIGDPSSGATLEPQLLAVNGEAKLARVLNLAGGKPAAEWMEKNKTEAALRVLEAADSLTPPAYIRDALELLHDRDK